ncbi:sugar ABC transporter substrate-binding protein [Sinorhizobium meliloti]|uniref:sugar ABC transporter substrate-binding protein n=1 Tax=Rhizobium meliloti TaxID=382 RepID=UPI000FD7F07F|nr:sugar ABC transporter substrate-binding protein [Sinorhizobium meliloti]MDW9375139.1 substrate-binding domain-containing protein [Sinorhizobium meliloti]MDW9493748.1 substrate-binding domain-containing protein [Sinorhizobium meliloti]MDW9561852.1 substrate-binding domain-containing protein [Sinorhizobium meliloti]MDW9649396.1 substrate-binding domain-containing protein [Sinorhizobium meliloti]MDW9859879.1 substrate-binding domain-containing protein [Sinorhizobium meliloti]
MIRKLIAGTALGLTLMAPAASAEGLSIAFISHSSASNTFWQAVKKGYDDACEKVGASCQLILTQTEGAVEQAVANLQAAIASRPDAIFVAIVDNNAYDNVIKEAVDAGILVLAVNVDDSEGAKGNARKAFIGQGFTAAGYSLAKAQSENFPKDGPLNLLVGVNAPGQNWSEQRAGGVTKFLEEYKAEHSDREVNITRIDSATDLALTADRIGAYLNANPDTTAYFDTGYWHAGVAKVLKDRGIEPGKVLLGGFDLVPEVLQQMEAGYVQVQVDQQPYMQGFIPVMQAYLWKTAGLTPSDVDTGQGIVTPKDVPTILELAKQGLR